MFRLRIHRHRTKFTVAAFATTCLLLTGAAIAIGAASDLDLSFGSGGKVTTPVGWGDSHAFGVAVQPDNKVVVAGDGDSGTGYAIMTLARYNADGSLDTTFDGDGSTYLWLFPGSSDDRAKAVAVQGDGKILVAGESINGTSHYFTVARFNVNGSLDTSFNTTGKVFTNLPGHAAALTIQADGKIVAAGDFNNGSNFDFAVGRYNPDGSLDTTFDGDGWAATAIGGGNDKAYGVAVQPDGKIVLTGEASNGANSDFAVARFNANGSLDTAFDYNGFLTTPIGTGADVASDISVQSDGKIVAAGYGFNGANNDFALARYNTDGSLDSSFDGDGILRTAVGSADDRAAGLIIQFDGKIVAAGRGFNGLNDDFAVARYNTDGSPDATFDGDGQLLTPIGTGHDHAFDLAMGSDGRLVAAGESFNGGYRFGAARYIGDPPPPAGPGTTAPPIPSVKITSPRRSKTSARKLKRLAGTAGPAGQVAKVEIALRRIDKKLLKRGRCLWLRNARAKFVKTKARRKKCSKQRFLRAAGTDSWSFKLSGRLPAGRYELFARVTLTTGETQTTFTKAQGNLRKFRVT